MKIMETDWLTDEAKQAEEITAGVREGHKQRTIAVRQDKDT